MIGTRLPVVAIIDYEMGNLFSVKQACESVGLQAFITSEKKEFLKADAAILPGVGAFGDAMETLNRLDMINPILDFVQSGRPFMGICLGMQLLMRESEEFGKYSGLDIVNGAVVKLPVKIDKDKTRSKVPQVGWNRVYEPLNASKDFWSDSPLQGICDGEFMYFVHSFYCKLDNSDALLSYTRYSGTDYCSSILWKNIFACQFHPEKSSTQGLSIYKNWSLSIKK